MNFKIKFMKYVMNSSGMSKPGESGGAPGPIWTQSRAYSTL